MKAFLWVFILLIGLSLVGKVQMLIDGSFYQPRSTKLAVLDTLLVVVMLVWAGWLLGGLA